MGELPITLKKIYWHTTFGKVEVVEQTFVLGDRVYRPLIQKLRVYCRSYSRTLQRAVTDFGADVSFSQAAEKMQKHLWNTGSCLFHSKNHKRSCKKDSSMGAEEV